MKNSTIIVGPLVFLVVASGIFYWAHSRDSVKPEGEPIARAAQGVYASPDYLVEGNLGPVTESEAVSNRESAILQQGPLKREFVVQFEQLSERSASSLALSMEEAAWLTRNGYPSAWELRNLHALDWGLVRAEALRGDEVAQNLLAERLYAAGDIAGAAAMFGNPRGRPSIYAMIRSSELDARLGRFPRTEDNHRLFMLYAEYARLMGDHKIDIVIRNVLPDTVNHQFMEQEALRSLPEFVLAQFELARRTNLPPPSPSARPNREQWQEIHSRGLPAVTIQTPSRFARQSGG